MPSDHAVPSTGPEADERPDDRRLPPVEPVESLGAALAAAGLPLLPARVFAALLATDDGRLTSAELVGLLHVSPAAVSGAVRQLTQMRWVRRERERGSRRDVYVVMDDAWHDAVMQTDQVYAPILAALGGAREVVGPTTRAGRRMQVSVEFLEFVTEEMQGVAQRWEAQRAQRAG